MATTTQRALAVLNALADDTVDSSVALRVGNAFSKGTQASTNEEKALVFLNFSKNTIRFHNPLKKSKLLVSTSIKSEPLEDTQIVLTPWEGIVSVE